jgi:hypothetical protein
MVALANKTPGLAGQSLYDESIDVHQIRAPSHSRTANHWCQLCGRWLRRSRPNGAPATPFFCSARVAFLWMTLPPTRLVKVPEEAREKRNEATMDGVGPSDALKTARPSSRNRIYWTTTTLLCAW